MAASVVNGSKLAPWSSGVKRGKVWVIIDYFHMLVS